MDGVSCLALGLGRLFGGRGQEVKKSGISSLQELHLNLWSHAKITRFDVSCVERGFKDNSEVGNVPQARQARPWCPWSRKYEVTC